MLNNEDIHTHTSTGFTLSTETKCNKKQKLIIILITLNSTLNSTYEAHDCSALMESLKIWHKLTWQSVITHEMSQMTSNVWAALYSSSLEMGWLKRLWHIVCRVERRTLTQSAADKLTKTHFIKAILCYKRFHHSSFNSKRAKRYKFAVICKLMYLVISSTL